VWEDKGKEKKKKNPGDRRGQFPLFAGGTLFFQWSALNFISIPKRAFETRETELGWFFHPTDEDTVQVSSFIDVFY
jgi:hypothetical protein